MNDLQEIIHKITKTASPFFKDWSKTTGSNQVYFIKKLGHYCVMETQYLY
ncbi:hypothetical protein SAMN04488028_104125 [Reichenbachiella agariperforans]|uniref:Uncharacterized protein n=1 Tax=Reichenbachiella agariperforans TaxID=156994 RepID=A0A1M6RD86_REIAG|nr:hypothetical protein SAMN04488028_104125 [Reichenbachiella agariperforans]